MNSAHVVDTTMFWSPTGGGVRRYLQTKQAWLAGQAGWTHTIAVPMRAAPRIGEARIPALPIPPTATMIFLNIGPLLYWCAPRGLSNADRPPATLSGIP